MTFRIRPLADIKQVSGVLQMKAYSISPTFDFSDESDTRLPIYTLIVAALIVERLRAGGDSFHYVVDWRDPGAPPWQGWTEGLGEPHLITLSEMDNFTEVVRLSIDPFVPVGASVIRSTATCRAVTFGYDGKAFLCLRHGDNGMDQIALAIGEDMALAALDLLACVIPPRTAAFRSFDALAVDHPSARRTLTADRFACHQQQRMIERQPKLVVTPQIELAPHRRNWRKTRRQHPPRQATAQQIEDRSTILRSGYLLGRPTCVGGGSNGSSTAHSPSVKSLGKARSARAYCARVLSVHIVDLQ